jgi:hypothetical protein
MYLLKYIHVRVCHFCLLTPNNYCVQKVVKYNGDTNPVNCLPASWISKKFFERMLDLLSGIAAFPCFSGHDEIIGQNFLSLCQYRLTAFFVQDMDARRKAIPKPILSRKPPYTGKINKGTVSPDQNGLRIFVSFMLDEP